MPIKFPEPPKQSVAALRQTLRTLSLTPEARALPQRFGIAALGGAQPSLPHQVYSLGLTELLKGGGVKDAQLVSWRYFVTTASPQVSSAEVNVDAKGGHSFAQLNTGPFNESTLTAVESLTQDPQVEAQSYDMRLLRIPALYVTAVWLKCDEPRGDLVVPIAPTIPILVAGKLYHAWEFEERVRKAAQEKKSEQEGFRTSGR